MTSVRVPEWPWRIVHNLADRRGVNVWLVGGAVRDLLLGRPVHDWDFVADHDALALARATGDALDGYFFPLDEERGTARVVLATGETPHVELDFAILRGADLEADLADRDFTINAMAVSPDHRLIDPVAGLRDLKAGLIRATHGEVFNDDPVRLLRAVRLEAELAFELEPQTETWVRGKAPLVRQPAPERLRDEVARGMAVPGVSAFIRRLDELRLVQHLLPELVLLQDLPQSPPSRFDVWEHTLRAADAVDGLVATVTGAPLPAGSWPLDDVPAFAWVELTRTLGRFAKGISEHLAVELCDHRDRLLLLRLAALLHEIGKPHTRSAKNGRSRFHGHQSDGARRAISRMQALRFSREESRRVGAMIGAHLRPAQLARETDVTRRAVYRYFRDTGDVGADTVFLSLADHLATCGPDLQADRWRHRLDVAQVLLYHYFEVPDRAIRPQLPIDGHDLMHALDLQPGPEIGRLLEVVREAVAAGDVKTREEALKLARTATE